MKISNGEILKAKVWLGLIPLKISWKDRRNQKALQTFILTKKLF